jgi:hypothetical protein
MNLPNKLTISRLVMAPLFFIAFFLPEWFGAGLASVSTVLVLVLFALTELSDLLDGYIARRYHLITDLGKVMDPFADTFSRLTYFVCLSAVGVMPVWAFIIIMWRDADDGKGKGCPGKHLGQIQSSTVCGLRGAWDIIRRKRPLVRRSILAGTFRVCLGDCVRLGCFRFRSLIFNLC